MGLADIAEGIEVTERQRDRGVATVDDTDEELATALGEYAEDLPCSPDAAATVLETFADGAAVDAAAHEAGVPPLTGAKTLHLLGVEGVSPLAPTARQVVRDWTVGDLGHAEARELTGASETEFALAAFVETHDPIDGVEDVVERVRSASTTATVDKCDHLAETMSGADEFY